MLTARVRAGFEGGQVSANRAWSAVGKDGEPGLGVRTPVRLVLAVAAAGRLMTYFWETLQFLLGNFPLCRHHQRRK